MRETAFGHCGDPNTERHDVVHEGLLGAAKRLHRRANLLRVLKRSRGVGIRQHLGEFFAALARGAITRTPDVFANEFRHCC